MEKRKSKFMYLLMIFGVLVPYLLNAMSIFPLNASAETAAKQTLVDNEQIKVEVEGQVVDEAQHWQVYFEKKALTDGVESQLKVRVNQASDTTNDDFVFENDWYTEKNFSSEGTGVLELIVPKDATALQLELQINERDEVGEVLEDQLSPDEVGPYELGLTQVTETNETAENKPEGTQNSTEEEATETETAGESTAEEAKSATQLVEIPEAGSSVGGFSLLSGNLVSRATLADPFKYFDSSNPTGIYPKHNTNRYVPAEGTSDYIKNYNYGNATKTTEAEDNIALYNITGSSLDFNNGYHEYGSSDHGRLNTKKTVSPTNDPNVFQVQLDTIGDAIRPIPKVDIVLVLDRSSSMVNNSTNGKTRWQQLKEAVTQFSNNMLSNSATHDVQIGLAAFGSASSNPYGGIASFGDFTLPGSGLPSALTGFTKSATVLQGHQMLASDPPSNSGTPTFLGVDAGLQLLNTTGYGARSDAKKVIITITDGDPTFRPTDAYTEGNNVSNSLNRLSKTKETGNILKMTASTTYFDGTGGQGDIINNRQPTVDFINNRYNQVPGFYRYGVGFHTGDSANAVVTALGPNGAFRATDVDSLIQALQTAISELISTIYKAVITDPMSTYVTLDTSSVQHSALLLSQTSNRSLTVIPSSDTANYPDFAKAITSNVTGTQIQLNNVNLGLNKDNLRQGYRITYNVTLKEAYRDNTFYPTNQTTYLANGDGNNKYYAVPSVKAPMPKVEFELTKVAAGTTIGLANAKFRLFDAATGGTAKSDEVTSDATGVLKFTNITPGTYWLRETVTPEGFQTMAPIQITVDRQGQVTGTGITGGKISNTLKQIDLRLNKKDPTGGALNGAVFKLKQGNTEYPLTAGSGGVHTLTDLKPGVYEVVETKAPDGFQVLGMIGTITITAVGEITFTPAAGVTGSNFTVDKTGQKIQITMNAVNRLKPFELDLLKRDANDNKLVLKGAIFTLYDKDPTDTSANAVATLNTGEDGKGQFKKADGSLYLLEAGKTYYFKETTAPDGYVLSTSIYKVSIAANGNVTVEKDGEAFPNSTITLGSADKNNQIGLTVDNDPKAPLPETGGPGRLIWLMTGFVLIALTVIYLFKARFAKEVL